ncbi:DUF4105 domain-containing protein [Rubrivirga sp.]|uniref:DUF4105 domain-containing protein n=1 Tax=Rubrivirga sp. TaxID=1885344 RepID=UPI003B52C569
MRVLLLLLLTSAASAQAPAGVGLTDQAEASLLTMLPGDEVYSLFGHSAIRIRDDAAGIDRTYNFGTFSFEQPYFVLRFLRGSLDYSLDTAPYEVELRKYQYLRRPIIEQTLALGPEVVRTLYDRLEVNALPENRDYRYDFFWDNCSTRLLDAVDSALVATGRPGLALPPTEAPRTFRQLLAPYTAGNPPVDLGIDVALGSPGDRTATAREEAFLPIELAAQLDRATVGGRPLVARRDTVFWVEGAGLPAPAPRWPLGLTLGLAAVGLGATALRRPSRWGRIGDAALFGVVGLMGVVLGLLWVATAHDVMGPNWNLVWAWPPHLALAVALARDRVGEGWRRYALVAAVGTGLAVVLWVVLPQRLPVEALPVAVLLAVRAGVWARGKA